MLDLQTAQRLSGVNLGFTTLPVHGVVARQVFDGSTSDPATATPAANKFVLLPGEVAGFANVISTSRGLTLIGVDIVGLPDAALLRAEDFQAETLSADTLGWAPAPIQPTVVVQPGDGFRGSDRVLLTFPADAIRNTWLRVTALATPRTGLARPDVFYFGNLIGDTGPDGAAPAVDARDFAAVRRNLFSRDAAAVSRYDFNDDGVIDNADLTVVRANQGRRLPPLTAPPAEGARPRHRTSNAPSRRPPGRRSILAEITALLLPVENVIIQK